MFRKVRAGTGPEHWVGAHARPLVLGGSSIIQFLFLILFAVAGLIHSCPPPARAIAHVRHLLRLFFILSPEIYLPTLSALSSVLFLRGLLDN